jgi:hypothetical protein
MIDFHLYININKNNNQVRENKRVKGFHLTILITEQLFIKIYSKIQLI